MNVGICYGDVDRQTWMRIEVPIESTIEQAIELSGLLKQYPEIDLTVQKVGIFGKVAKLDTVLNDGDRVEIYRPIIVDPKLVKRRKL